MVLAEAFSTLLSNMGGVNVFVISIRSESLIIRVISIRVEEVAPRLRTLDIIEDVGSSPSIHMVAHNYL